MRRGYELQRDLTKQFASKKEIEETLPGAFSRFCASTITLITATSVMASPIPIGI